MNVKLFYKGRLKSTQTYNTILNNRIPGIHSILLLMSYIYITFMGVKVNASALTDLLTTDAFSGSFELMSKFNVIGFLVSAMISLFGLLGLVDTVVTIMCTLVVLANRPLADKIHAIKEAGKGKAALGLPFIAKDTLMVANHGTGLDALVSFVLGLAPDIIEYSDLAGNGKYGNYTEDETIPSYLLKKSLPAIFTITAFTLAFSGTLWRIYGEVSDAIAVVADRFVDLELDNYIDNLINSGHAYQFGYDDDGTKLGKFKQNIAEDMYTSVLKILSDNSTDAKMAIGTKIDSLVTENLTKEAIQQLVGTKPDSSEFKWDGSDASVSNLTYSVTINSQDTAYSSADTVFQVTGTEGLSCGYTISTSLAGDALYLHLTLQKKSNSIETNYFNLEDENTDVSAPTTDNSNQDGSEAQTQ